MNDLKCLFIDLGFTNVQTYLQSGNVIFYNQHTNENELSLIVEKGIKEKFNYQVSVLVFNIQELEDIYHKNPFPNQINNLYYCLTKTESINKPATDILKAKASDENIFIDKNVIYISCPSGYGKTKLNNNFLEKKLDIVATTRNHKTINEVLNLCKNL